MILYLSYYRLCYSLSVKIKRWEACTGYGYVKQVKLSSSSLSVHLLCFTPLFVKNGAWYSFKWCSISLMSVLSEQLSYSHDKLQVFMQN